MEFPNWRTEEQSAVLCETNNQVLFDQEKASRHTQRTGTVLKARRSAQDTLAGDGDGEE